MIVRRKRMLGVLLLAVVMFASTVPAFGASTIIRYDVKLKTKLKTDRAEGWHVIGGKEYYVSDDGYFLIGPRKMSDGKWYFFDINGVLQKKTGWVKLPWGKWYLKKGIVQSGLKKIKGKKYLFQKHKDVTFPVQYGKKQYGIFAYGMMCDNGLYKKKIISHTGRMYKLPKKSKDKKCKKISRLIAKCSKKKVKTKKDLEKAHRATRYVYEFWRKCKYSMRAKNYNKPYGVFYSKKASCAGTASALTKVFKTMKMKKVKHKNKMKFKHQWPTLVMDGKKGWAEAMIGACRYGKYGYPAEKQTFVVIDYNSLKECRFEEQVIYQLTP